MMNLEDLEPLKTKVKPLDLDTLSIDELKDYIGNLEAEIARARAMIASKQAHRGVADTFFKT